MNHWHNYPFVRIILPFIFGILIAIQFGIQIPYVLLIFFFLICVLLTYFTYFRTYKLRFLFGYSFSFLMLGFGNICANSFLEIPSIPNTESAFVKAVIIEPPSEKERSIKLILKANSIKNSDAIQEFDCKILAYIAKDSSSLALKLGDEIVFKSRINTPNAPTNPHAFDYKKYLAFKRIHYQTYIRNDDWHLLDNGRGNKLKLWADQIRSFLIQKLKDHKFEKAEMGVASALLLGYDEILDPETRNEFANAGAMHVLCVSGLHVGIIYLVFSSLLNFLKRNKNGILIRTLVLLSIIWLYAFITGLSPSVLRASTMLSFIIIGEGMKRKSNIYNSISASAFLLLLINPLMIMEVGFQLSYAAVLAIVSIYPILSKRIWIKNKFLQKIRDILIVSLAAQIGTFPLAIYYFHQFPLYFLLTNLFVVSFAGFIIYLGFLFFILSSIPYVNEFAALLLKYSIKVLNAFIGFIDSLPSTSISSLVFSLLAVALVYVLIISVFRSILLKNKVWFCSLMLSLILLLVLMLNRNFIVKQNKQIIIYDAGYNTALDFINGNRSYIMFDEDIEPRMESFMAKSNWVYNGIKYVQRFQIDSIDNYKSEHLMKEKLIMQFYDHKILILDGSKKCGFEGNFDLMVLTNNPKLSIREIDSLYAPEQIIIAKSNYKSKQRKWEIEESETPLWFIAKQGAFIYDLKTKR